MDDAYKDKLNLLSARPSDANTNGAVPNGHVQPKKLAASDSSSSLTAFIDGIGNGVTEVDGLRRRHVAQNDVMERSSFEVFACDESGMHGMPIIGNPRNFLLRRLFWLVLVLSSFGLLTYVIQERVQKYRSFETSTNVVLKYEPRLQFPAVTICNFNPFYQSLVNDTVDIAILSLIRSNLVDSDLRALGQATARTIPRNPRQPSEEGGNNGAGNNGAGNNGGGNTGGGDNGAPPPPRRKRQAGTPPTRPPTAATSQQATTTRTPATTARAQMTQSPSTTVASSTSGSAAPTTGRTRRTRAQSNTSLAPTTETTTNSRWTRPQAATTSTASMLAVGATTIPDTQRPGTPTSASTTARRQVQPSMSTGQDPGGNAPDRQTTTARQQLLALLTNETALNAILEPVDVGNYFLQNGIQIDRMLTSCKFRGTECNASDFQHVFTTFGNCYTFNADQSRTVAQAGQGHGLELILDIESAEYINGVDQSVGARVLLHSKDESPHITVDSLGFAAGPGQSTLVGISSKRVTNLGKPYNANGCRGNEESDQLKYFENYTISNCALECFADLAETVCGCRAPYMPAISNVSVCNPIQMFRCIDEVQTAIVQGTNSTFDCITNHKCVQPCEYQAYSYVLSTTLYPSSNSVKQVGLTAAQEQQILLERRTNYVHLNMFFEELNYEKVEQVAAYDWLSLVSEIGGLAGILLGASALTFLEFADFILGRCVAGLRYLLGTSHRKGYNARGRRSFQGSIEMSHNWTLETKPS